MSFQDGDFLKIEYTARRASDNSVVFTTDEKLANSENIYNKDTKYGPQLVVIGKNSIVSGVDKALKGMNLNESKKIDLDPKDAFGERREDMVSVMHLSDFRRRDINPEPGLQIDIDGIIATVKSVNSGRVVVDANHPLAGEKLLYEVKVVEKLGDEKSKVVSLAELYDLKPDSVEVNGNVAKIVFGGKTEKNSDYLVHKATFVQALFRYMPSMEKVVAEEEYLKPKES